MEMKVIPEILALCICWLIQKGEMVKKTNKYKTSSAEERGKKDIVEILGLGWLLLILKKFIAFRCYMWFLVLCIIPVLTILNYILNMSW